MRRWLVAAIAAASTSSLQALPTMVRLGYPNCVSCHVNPQGGGTLNRYGRGIDEAQSLRSGEYTPNTSAAWNAISLGGILDPDLRTAGTSQVTAPSGSNGPTLWINRSRFFFRNVARPGKGFRITTVVEGETDPTMRRSKPYDPALRPGLVMVTTAMLQWRPRESQKVGMKFGVGRDALPQGLLIPDQTTFIKARNRLGYYDTPTQAKAFFWGKKWLVAPYAFAPSYREVTPARESGGGFMAEYDLLGKGKTIIGVSGLRGSDLIADRTMAGVYTRLGFGSWGVLAEHDFTQRDLRPAYGAASFGQQATYFQLFRYWREWLVTSAILERLTVQAPYVESLWAYKAEVSARLSSILTVGLRAGVQRDTRSGVLSPVAMLQLTAKSVN